MFQQRAKKNEIEVVKAVMRLKQLNGLDRVESLGEGLYTHVNTRGRKRFIQICSSQEKARLCSEDKNGDYFKSWAHWVCLYD